jgi:uncharacterized protein with HEPN domain
MRPANPYMNNETKKRLLDAQEACRAIQEFTAGSNLASYTADSMRRAAVERKFEILGEALSHAEESAPELAERIPEIRRIIGMRNRIIHGYDAVDDEIIWDTVQGKIPSLLEQLSTLLNEKSKNEQE